uniref:Uncharacterized protein n=1 Tax=Anguilla anguilla TaxID=7936 RepID=A0A0E9TG14_ANGAN
MPTLNPQLSHVCSRFDSQLM